MKDRFRIKIAVYAGGSVFVCNFFYEIFAFITNPSDFLIITNAFLLSVLSVTLTFLVVSIGANLLPENEQKISLGDNQILLLSLNIFILIICLIYVRFFPEPSWLSSLANYLQVFQPILLAVCLILINRK